MQFFVFNTTNSEVESSLDQSDSIGKSGSTRRLLLQIKKPTNSDLKSLQNYRVQYTNRWRRSTLHLWLFFFLLLRLGLVICCLFSPLMCTNNLLFFVFFLFVCSLRCSNLGAVEGSFVALPTKPTASFWFDDYISPLKTFTKNAIYLNFSQETQPLQLFVLLWCANNLKTK